MNYYFVLLETWNFRNFLRKWFYFFERRKVKLLLYISIDFLWGYFFLSGLFMIVLDDFEISTDELEKWKPFKYKFQICKIVYIFTYILCCNLFRIGILLVYISLFFVIFSVGALVFSWYIFLNYFFFITQKSKAIGKAHFSEFAAHNFFAVPFKATRALYYN